METNTIIEIILFLLGILSFSITAFFIRRNERKYASFSAMIALVFGSLFVIGLLIFNLILSIILILYILIVFWIGTFNYKRIKVRTINIESPKIKRDFKILFAADFQFDKREDNFNEKALENSIDIINENLKDVDLLLLGGDYINYENHLEKFFEDFSQIKKPEESFSITGNHDYIAMDEIVKKLKMQNYQVLFNDFKRININDNHIQLAGVEDLWRGHPDINEYEAKLKSDDFTILLSHNPDYIDLFDSNKVDLVLSGHYHKGQVQLIPRFPFSRAATKYNYGYYKKVKLYVTSGLGGSFLRGKLGIYARYFARSEIVIIKVTPVKK